MTLNERCSTSFRIVNFNLAVRWASMKRSKHSCHSKAVATFFHDEENVHTAYTDSI